MNTTALSISVVGLFISFTGMIFYFFQVSKNEVPAKPIGLIISLLAGIGLGAYALILVYSSELSSMIPVAIPSFISIFMGFFFLWVIRGSKAPLGEITVKVGDYIHEFQAKNQDGEEFSSESLKGERTLLKFYRGSWCPYCSLELRMFEEMKPDLQKFGVNVVALSNDSVDDANKHRKRDGITMTLLSDPELKVVRKYGVEHRKAFGADSKNVMMIFGLPFPKTFKFKHMSIPTSILIDENGMIKWIDQSEDVRIRANRKKVFEAISRSFDSIV